jgi:hypothetical protein
MYRAPSFSWACIDALIEWPLRASVTTLDLAVIDIDVKQESSDAFGRVLSCSLEVRAQIRKGMVTSRKRIAANGVDLTWELRTTSNKLLGTAFMDSDDLDEGSANIDCLLLDKKGKGQALLLEKVSEYQSEYFRIGVAELLGLDDHDDEFFEDHIEQVIKIV